MSRSYREPYWVDGYGSKCKRDYKRYASKAVRRAKEVPNGKAYRKFFDPWKITDYKNRWDPWPWVSVNFLTGKITLNYPIPEWKANRK